MARPSVTTTPTTYADVVDTLAIQLAPRAGDTGEGHWTAVDLMVNGQPLSDLVTEFEGQHGYEPAGGYDSFAVEGLQPPAERLTGTPNLWPVAAKSSFWSAVGAARKDVGRYSRA